MEHYLRNLAEPEWWSARGMRLLELGFNVAVILLALWLLRRLLFLALHRSFAPLEAKASALGPARVSRLRTLQFLSQSAVHYALIFVAFVMVLRTMGLDPTSALATAGVAGLAIGFGAQKLVRDVIGGFFILLEDQFSVGDVVTIGPITGVVEEVGMRATRIRDENGRLNLMANGDIGTVINYSRGPYRLTLDLALPADTDRQALESAVAAAGSSLQEGASPVVDVRLLGLVSLEAARATYRISASVPPEARAQAEVRLREALWAHLQAAGIQPS